MLGNEFTSVPSSRDFLELELQVSRGIRVRFRDDNGTIKIIGRPKVISLFKGNDRLLVERHTRRWAESNGESIVADSWAPVGYLVQLLSSTVPEQVTQVD